jgi:hypothetical protein
MISTSRKPDDTHILLKLVTGELLISRFVSETANVYVVEYPMIANRYIDDETGKFRVYLTSFNPFDDIDIIFTLDKKHVIFRSILDKEAIKFYEENLSIRYSLEDDQNSVPIGFSIH